MADPWATKLATGWQLEPLALLGRLRPGSMVEWGEGTGLVTPPLGTGQHPRSQARVRGQDPGTRLQARIGGGSKGFAGDHKAEIEGLQGSK